MIVEVLTETCKDDQDEAAAPRSIKTIELVVSSFNLLIELVQGPCGANQMMLSGTNILSLCRMIITHDFKELKEELPATQSILKAAMHVPGRATFSMPEGESVDCPEVKELKACAVKMLHALVEGRRDTIVHQVSSCSCQEQ